MLNFKKYALVGILLMVTFSIVSADTLSKNARISPYVKVLLDRLEERNLAVSDYKTLGLEKSENGTRISLLIVKNGTGSLENRIRAIGGDVGTESGKFLTAYVPENRVAEIAGWTNISYITHYLPAHPALDVSARVIQANWVHNGQSPLARSYKGKNVVIGIVDSGVDWSHPAFKNPDGTTRILYIWDQTTSGKKPSFFNYGTEWNSGQINSGSCTEIDGPKKYGHGTHVTGIAAGNGLPDEKYVGIAPEADIIAVKTDFDFNHIIDAVEYIFRHAGVLGEPAVVNLSLATQQGPHDGTSTPEQMLASKVGKGRIIVAAASNEGDINVHVSYTITNEERATGFVAYSNDTHDVNLDIWYSGGNIDVALGGLDANLNVIGSSGWVSPGSRTANQTFSASGKTYGIYTIDATETNNPFNGLRHVYIEITNGNGSYDFTSNAITWVLKTRGTGTLHAWVYGDNGEFDSFSGSMDGMTFVGGDNHYSVGMPATSDALITVGSFVTKTRWTSQDGHTYQLNSPPSIGDISPFSSRGPTRDGRIKPDIMAPGEVIASAMSSDANLMTSSPQRVLPGEKYFVLQGTSMASPHVAGTVALMLEKDSGLTPALAKQYLTQTATSDGYTGTPPNNDWGYGKVNAFQVMSLLTTGVGQSQETRFPEKLTLLEAYPNPFSVRGQQKLAIFYRLPREEMVQLRIVNILGQTIKIFTPGKQLAGKHRIFWNGRNEQAQVVPSGIYFYELKAGDFHLVKKMVLVR